MGYYCFVRGSLYWINRNNGNPIVEISPIMVDRKRRGKGGKEEASDRGIFYGKKKKKLSEERIPQVAIIKFAYGYAYARLREKLSPILIFCCQFLLSIDIRGKKKYFYHNIIFYMPLIHPFEQDIICFLNYIYSMLREIRLFIFAYDLPIII